MPVPAVRLDKEALCPVDSGPRIIPPAKEIFGLPAALDYLWLLLVGLMAGASGGLLGIGGSVVMIPGMVLVLGPEGQHLYQASAMIVNFFVVAPAVVRHTAIGATFPAVTRWMVPSAVLSVIIGVQISELAVFRGAGRGYLQIAFAGFLGYVVAYNLLRVYTGRRLPRMTPSEASRLPRWRIALLAGLPAGLFGGLLGVGGGLVAVPAQQLALRIPLPNAIANSASTILWTSIVGAVVKNLQLAAHGFSVWQSLILALCLAPSAMIGSYYAAGKVHQWPVRLIRALFIVLLLYCGIRLFAAGWMQVGLGDAS